MYASFLGIEDALHLRVFRQPLKELVLILAVRSFEISKKEKRPQPFSRLGPYFYLAEDAEKK